MKKVQVEITQKTRNQVSGLKFEATDSKNMNIPCKQKRMKMKQTSESGIPIRNINQDLLRNRANKR